MPICTICHQYFDARSELLQERVCGRCLQDSIASSIAATNMVLPLPLHAPLEPPNIRMVFRRTQRLRTDLFISLPRSRVPIPPAPPIRDAVGARDICFSRYSRVVLRVDFDEPNPPNVLSENPNYSNLYSITIGDLHGNTLTLIMFLVRFGFIEFSSTEHYQRMRQIILGVCSDQPLTPVEYIEFRNLLYQCRIRNKFNIRVIRLLGDIIGDRQSNDALTLAVIGFLLSENPASYAIHILFSNHDKNLIDYLIDRGCDANPFVSLRRLLDFYSHMYHTGDALSLRIRENIFEDMQIYLSCMYFFDYELLRTENNIHGEFCTFTHAALQPQRGLTALYDIMNTDRNLARTIPSPIRSFAHLSAQELTHLISVANQHFRNMLLNIFYYEFDQSFPSLSLHRAVEGGVEVVLEQSLDDLLDDSPDILKYRTLFIESSPCFDVVWFRLSTQGFSDNYFGAASLRLPQLQGGVKLFNVHGHDSVHRADDISLDNQVGKFDLTGRQELRLIIRQHYQP